MATALEFVGLGLGVVAGFAVITWIMRREGGRDGD